MARRVSIPLFLGLIMFLVFLFLYITPWKSETVTMSITTTKIRANDAAPRNNDEGNLLVDSIDAHGFWKGQAAVRHHVHDGQLASALLKFLKKENVHSFMDLGAGMGLYSKMTMKENIFTSCYDGNPNTAEISEGRCATVDLSKPINFFQHDWIMSLEVGEHIPAEFEDIFLNNLHRINKRGIILSWGIENQGGHGHVNNRNNGYIKGKICKLGYTVDEEAETALRAAAQASWFKNTIMVFRKNLKAL